VRESCAIAAQPLRICAAHRLLSATRVAYALVPKQIVIRGGTMSPTRVLKQGYCGSTSTGPRDVVEDETAVVIRLPRRAWTTSAS
jgi:hypothetical protein